MISIVVPVYNAEQYIGRCLDSILKSTYRDFEIIIVDDGSTDQSSQICKKYSRGEERIKFFIQKHKGVSVARNKGIDESQGEWIVFVDADDMISMDFLQLIIEYESSAQDLLLFDYVKLTHGFEENELFISDSPKVILNYGKEDRILLINKLLSMNQLAKKRNVSLLSSWGKAYRRDVIVRHSIRFLDDIIIGEDRLFNIEYLLRIRFCTYIAKEVYYMRIHSGSVMRSFNLNYLQNDYSYQDKLKYILMKNKIFIHVKESYYDNVLTNIVDVLVRGIFNPYSNRKYHENCRLCQEMQQYEIYRRALKYNNEIGSIPRRVLLFFFREEFYCIVFFICKASFIILEKTDRL